MDLFLLISIILFIIAHIFLLIQGIINYKFYRFNDRKIIVERTLFEQFSYEVYSSIKSPLSINNEIKVNCDNSLIPFNLNLDTFFDCRGLFNKELNFCKNKIVNNNTNCDSQGYINYQNDLDSFLDYDPRITHCKYYSKFKQKIKKFFNKSICQNQNDFNKFDYYNLLKNSVKERDDEGRLNPCPENYKRCGILDTKRNILCIESNKNCPNNEIITTDETDNIIEINDNRKIKFINNDSRDIVKSIILSENIPLSHEWDLIVRETYEELDDTNIQKRRDITSEDFKLLNMEADNTYIKVNVNGLSLKVKDVINSNFIKGYNGDKYNENQILNIYTRNYIGFKNTEELNKFYTIFNNESYTDSPLYKISTSGHHPLVTIIFPSFFIAISIIYLVLIFIKIVKDTIFNILFYVFSVIIIIFCLAELIIISVHFYKCPNIYIDMDDRME